VKLKYNLLRCLAVVVSLACLQTQAYSDVLAEQDRVVVPLKARAFRLEDVRLLDGPFKSAMELDRQYLLSLDVDRLLHNFRINADLGELADPGSHYTRRVVHLAVRLVVEDGLPYRGASWHLWRDHRVFVPWATIQNWVEATGEKSRAANRHRVSGRGSG